MSFSRTKIQVGTRLKVYKLATGTNPNGQPYWKFYVPFTTQVNGESIVFKHLWCRVWGKPIAGDGEWVEIESITDHYAVAVRNKQGGITCFDGLTVEVKRLEKDYGEEDDE